MPGVVWRRVSADGAQPGLDDEPVVEGSVAPVEVVIRFLRTTIAIEHSIMVEYLFAAMSPRDTDEASVLTAIAIEGWRIS